MNTFEPWPRTRENVVDIRRSALERINQRLDAIRAGLERANAAIDGVSQADGAFTLSHREPYQLRRRIARGR